MPPRRRAGRTARRRLCPSPYRSRWRRNHGEEGRIDATNNPLKNAPHPGGRNRRRVAAALQPRAGDVPGGGSEGGQVLAQGQPDRQRLRRNLFCSCPARTATDKPAALGRPGSRSVGGSVPAIARGLPAAGGSGLPALAQAPFFGCFTPNGDALVAIGLKLRAISLLTLCHPSLVSVCARLRSPRWPNIVNRFRWLP